MQTFVWSNGCARIKTGEMGAIPKRGNDCDNTGHWLTGMYKIMRETRRRE